MLLEMDDPCWLQGILEVQQREPLLNNELNEKKKNHFARCVENIHDGVKTNVQIPMNTLCRPNKHELRKMLQKIASKEIKNVGSLLSTGML